jgi:hypothetical protein
LITEYPLEHQRYDQPEYEPFWTAAAALDLPLSLHTATRRQGRIRGAGDKTLRDESTRATYRERLGKAIYRFKGLPLRRRGPYDLGVKDAIAHLDALDRYNARLSLAARLQMAQSRELNTNEARERPWASR